jgi:hypothetical protein
MLKRKGQGKTGEISLYVVVDGGGQATWTTDFIAFGQLFGVPVARSRRQRTRSRHPTASLPEPPD